MNDVHSWDNLPYEWSCKQTELLHLGQQWSHKIHEHCQTPQQLTCGVA